MENRKEDRNMECSFTLAPMSDAYIDIILGAIAKVDTANITAATGRMSTVYKGTCGDVLDAVKACFVQAWQPGVHMTMQMTLTDDSEPQTAEAICINESLSRKVSFPVDCQFAIYPETENTAVMKEAAGKAEALGIYRQMNGRKILLKADVHDLFAYFADLYRHCHETYDRFAIEISCSVNSPTAE